MNTSTTLAVQDTSVQAWLAVIAVGLATFAVVTTEMLPVGLLTSIAETLKISTGTAGLLISAPTLLAALFAPLVVILSGEIDRRKILCALLALLVIANIASALATNLLWMLAARVLVGGCMGGIWAIAGSLAVRLVPSHRVGMATSIIFGGVAAASVLGVPIGVWIGDLAGWRWVFGSMAIFSTMLLLLHLAIIPPLSVKSSVSVRQFAVQLGNPKLQLGLLLTLMIVAGHFMAFTFVRPLLISIAGFDPKWIGMLLFAYGTTGIIGNFIAGMFAVRQTQLTILMITLGLLLTPILFLYVGDNEVVSVITLLLWGLVYGSVSVGLMTWIMKIAPQAMEVATALYVAVFNIGIALGAWLGGGVVDHFGLSGNLAFTAVLATLTVLLSAGVYFYAYREKVKMMRR